MKLDKLIYSVREALKEYSDDSDLSDRFILFLIDLKRSLLLSQKLNSFATKIPTTATQSLCVALEDANRYKCGIDINCDTVRRSVMPIPKMFDTNIGSSLIAVRPLDVIGAPFTKIDMSLVPYISYSPYNTKVFTFVDDDNYLYAYSEAGAHKFLECVEVSAVFETPTDLQNFNNCCDCDPSVQEPCFTSDTEYPIPGEMVDVVRKMVVDDLVRLINIPEDTENDGESFKK